MANEIRNTDTEQSEQERVEAAQLYVKQLKAFYAHAGLFVLGMAIIFTVNLFTNLSAGIAGEWSAWWSVWALVGWGAGVGVHGLVVWLNRPRASASNWEQRQIEKVLGTRRSAP